ncbi:hypothetical protein SSX86_000316 [Deinandra increscens subsp. villosa]|uniref:SBP-type domain-containing protein n=1 Tax=Deinandra increscens subsp. villosa TaxID=3103831 RepID=A0AAP0E0M7_9ASTR
MEWNLKIPCWDFTEFEQETIPNIDLKSGSKSLNFSVDLKLGQVINSRNKFKDCLNLKGSTSVSKIGLSPSGSSKRARSVNKLNPGVDCVVDECKADLSNCKEYHRRHKVCEIHSKTPEVSIHGQKQRFCQQCSRFHSLEEFDEGKRSCRKRLDGHNRRRRKPQPDTSHAATLLSTPRGPFQFVVQFIRGTTMLQFSSPHVYQTTTLANPNPMWAGPVNSKEEPVYSTRIQKQNPYPKSSSGTKKVTPEQQQQQQQQQKLGLFHNGSGSCLKLNHQTSQPKVGYLPPGRVVPPVVQSDRALSLLSSSPSQTSCTTPRHVVHPPNSFAVMPDPLDLGGGYGGIDSVMDRHVTPDGEALPRRLAFYWE